MTPRLTVCRIMKDFYLAERDPTKRPRVFGMTASPVDAKVDVVKAAKFVLEPRAIFGRCS